MTCWLPYATLATTYYEAGERKAPASLHATEACCTPTWCIANHSAMQAAQHPMFVAGESSQTDNFYWVASVLSVARVQLTQLIAIGASLLSSLCER